MYLVLILNTQDAVVGQGCRQGEVDKDTTNRRAFSQT